MSDSAPSNPTLLDRWTRLSLARRIMLAAAVWGLVVLVGGALALSIARRRSACWKRIWNRTLLA